MRFYDYLTKISPISLACSGIDSLSSPEAPFPKSNDSVHIYQADHALQDALSRHKHRNTGERDTTFLAPIIS